jgi:tetratricopeptide (TPR) repeat protein
LNSLYVIDRIEERTDESVVRVDAAIAEYPDSARLYVLKGSIALNAGKGAEAESNFKKAIALEPKDLKAYQELARYFAATGRVNDAISTYDTAVLIQPGNAQVHHLLGVLHEMNGNQQKAIDNYEKAIAASPNLGEAKNNLAYIFADSGTNLDRALDLAQDAKALLPNSANAADTLGWVLLKRGVAGAAISYLKEAVAGTEADNASLGIVRYHLGLAYDTNGDSALAAETLQQALDDLEAKMEAARAAGRSADEPPWAADARSVLDRLSRS